MLIKIDSVMSKNIVFVKETDRIQFAYNQMKTHQIHHLPVVDQHNQVIGILSYCDHIKHFKQEDLLTNYISRQILTVSHDSELLTVVQKMITQRVSSILISEKENLIGIITSKDLLKILADLLKPEEDTLSSLKNWFYKMPINEIANKLADMGI